MKYISNADGSLSWVDENSNKVVKNVPVTTTPQAPSSVMSSTSTPALPNSNSSSVSGIPKTNTATPTYSSNNSTQNSNTAIKRNANGLTDQEEHYLDFLWNSKDKSQQAKATDFYKTRIDSIDQEKRATSNANTQFNQDAKTTSQELANEKYQNTLKNQAIANAIKEGNLAKLRSMFDESGNYLTKDISGNYVPVANNNAGQDFVTNYDNGSYSNSTSNTNNTSQPTYNFNSVDEADNANLPSGTIVYIQGKKAVMQ